MSDKVKIECPKCRASFGENYRRIRAGYKMPCPQCAAPITFDSGSDNPSLRKALSAARKMRLSAGYTTERFALTNRKEMSAYDKTEAAFKYLEDYERRLSFAVYKVSNMAADLHRRHWT